MSDGCKRPKNPCMVCKRPVTTKTGLQCQGSCKSWIHFTCCSYTPGKIKDIKAKLINVRCPCPDCTAQGPKEVVVNPSYTCLNKICPGNKPQKCPIVKNENKMCQQPSSSSGSCKEWPGIPCSGKSCKTNAQDDGNCDRRCHPIPPLLCGPPPNRRSRNDCPTTPTESPPTPPRRNSQQTPRVMPSISIIENMCETVGLLSNQLNLLMCKMTEVLTPKPAASPERNSCCCPKNGEKKKPQQAYNNCRP